jgi:ferrous iron transport protein B
MRFALIGQPNCGKSTLFNQVAGYKAQTGNFSGTTVEVTESTVRVAGEIVQIVDLPGTYTLLGGSPAEREAADYLAAGGVDVLINVVDATHLAPGLELTLEILRSKRPTVVALNMLDEASRLGLHIDGPGLGNWLGVPVLPLVASKGRGVRNLFVSALGLGRSLSGELRPHRAVAADLDLDPAGRHSLAGDLAERFVSPGERVYSWRDRLDEVLLHPVGGYLVLVAVLLAFFESVYGLGSLIEPPVLALFGAAGQAIGGRLGAGSLPAEIIGGVLQGIAGGAAIVLPYLIPFLLGLGLLEDVGYLPRAAFLMDSMMHRMGLHGKAIVPFILGYGCNVPAVMSTRTLEEPRDRYLAAALSTLVPCAARLAVVFGLVAFYLGPLAGMGLYFFNLLVIAVTGRILTRLLPEDTPGLILEMPSYHMPTPRSVLHKAWFRIREFVVEAWPALILGSAVLAVLTYFHADRLFNAAVRPLTWGLGLPAEVGLPLIFGILRKELSLVMLSQALGSSDFNRVLTTAQMLVYATFVMFYIPCLATLSALRRELGARAVLSISALTVLVSVLAGLAVRAVAALFGAS